MSRTGAWNSAYDISNLVSLSILRCDVIATSNVIRTSKKLRKSLYFLFMNIDNYSPPKGGVVVYLNI